MQTSRLNLNEVQRLTKRSLNQTISNYGKKLPLIYALIWKQVSWLSQFKRAYIDIMMTNERKPLILYTLFNSLSWLSLLRII